MEIARHCTPRAQQHSCVRCFRPAPHPFEKRYVPRPCFLLHTHCPSYTSPFVYSHLERPGLKKNAETPAQRHVDSASQWLADREEEPSTGRSHGEHHSSTGPRRLCHLHMYTCTRVQSCVRTALIPLVQRHSPRPTPSPPLRGAQRDLRRIRLAGSPCATSRARPCSCHSTRPRTYRRS